MDTWSFAFTNTRQAALMDTPGAWLVDPKKNLLGLRMIVLVNYTEKAFTKQYVEMMTALGEKNGLSIDGTPIIRYSYEISALADEELISLKTMAFHEEPFSQAFAIGPLIEDPRKGAIAFDAFLIMAALDGSPLPGEQIFARQFECLRKTGDWCEQ
jgi:hypothetical protein